MTRPIGKGRLSFGKGMHFCPGTPPARPEALTLLGIRLERIRWIEAM
ncbi:MAG: cytochrome P450 [Mycobacterium sp.]|nr:cytochrome P450 [Mycobacterium sp.]